jgi:FixJ family two-component response regulator
MNEGAYTVFLVDDDPGVLKSLARLLRTSGYDSRTYASAREFLRDHDPAASGCAVLDIAMPGLDGMQLQHELAVEGIARPIIFLTGRGDIPTSVRAMKAGAVDFLTKPVDRNDLLAAIERARRQEAVSREVRAQLDSFEAKLVSLTPREREVLQRVVAGKLNKQIAADLGTVEKTIKVHRGRMMAKMGARSIVDLVRMVERAGFQASDRRS